MFGVLAIAFLFVSGRAQIPLLTPELLEQLRQQFPAADTDRDGVLTEAEARAYYATMRGRRPASPNAAGAPAPTLADVAYGPHARNVLDFWSAPTANSARPAPLVVFIHGGGFLGGDKSSVRRGAAIQMCLDAGVSFAAINYRFLTDTPIQDILRDCGRAIQFLRSRAGEWHLDRTRLAVHGDSAGAGASLWIAVHPDLAEPESSDPVRRESSRVTCVGLNSTQFSYDLQRWAGVFGQEAVERFGSRYNSPELYGLRSFDALRGPEGAKIRADCDMLGLLGKDTPPLFISVTLPTLELENTNQFLHHPKHSQLVYERCRELGIRVVASIPALQIKPPADGPQSWRDFVFAQLGVNTPAPAAASAP